jgi:hypothetical protein
MTVTATSAFSGPFTPNGATTSFPFTFVARAADRVSVVRRSSTGVDTPIGGYSVTLASAGGTITFGTAPAAGDPLYIYSNPDFTQQVNFANQGNWPPTAVNDALDNAAVRDVFLLDGFNRSLHARIGESVDALPSRAQRANMILAFDGNGNPVATSLAASGPKGDPGSPGGGYATRTAMAARPSPALYDDVYLTEPGREGKFIVALSSAWTAAIVADVYGGVFVQSTANSAYVYVRVLPNPNVLYVKHFGVAAANSEATNTAIVSAILAQYLPGNITLFFPDGVIWTQVLIPMRSETYLSTVTIRGETSPATWFGTITGPPYTMTTKGTMLRSAATKTSPTAGAIFEALTTASFSNVRMVAKDIAFRNSDNPHLHGIMAYNAQQFSCDNVQIDTPVWSSAAADPTSGAAYGIRTPKNGNGAFTDIRNTSISGYYVAIEANEHTVGDNIAITACKYGIEFASANHGSNFGRVAIQRCQRPILGSGLHRVRFAQLDLEHANPAVATSIGGIDTPGNTAIGNGWQVTVYDIDDGGNAIFGGAVYTGVLGGFGIENTLLRNGGGNFQMVLINDSPLGTNVSHGDVFVGTASWLVNAASPSNGLFPITGKATATGYRSTGSAFDGSWTGAGTEYGHGSIYSTDRTTGNNAALSLWGSTINLGGSTTGTQTTATVTSSAIDLAAGKVLKVNGTQVVGGQGGAVSDATDATTVIAQLNTLLARLRAHGLIAP